MIFKEKEVISNDEFQELIGLHAEWRCDRTQGKRLSLMRKDLKQVSFADLDVYGIELKYCDLSGVDFSESRINDSQLSNNCFNKANFSNCKISNCNLRQGYFSDANFADANVQDADFTGSSTAYVDLSRAEIMCCNLSSTTLYKANFTDTYFTSVIGNGRDIKSLQLVNWKISYTATHLSIGCQQHLIEDWWKLTRDDFEAIDEEESWYDWLDYRDLLKNILTKFPANPYVGSDGKSVKAAFQEN